MAIEVKRKDREAFESMLKRFNREVLKSGILNIARENRFREKEPNRNAKRKSALRKAQIRSERKKLFSRGVFQPITNKKRGRR